MLTKEQYLKFQKESVHFADGILEFCGENISKEKVKYIIVGLFINLEENYIEGNNNELPRLR